MTTAAAFGLQVGKQLSEESPNFASSFCSPAEQPPGQEQDIPSMAAGSHLRRLRAASHQCNAPGIAQLHGAAPGSGGPLVIYALTKGTV